MPTYEYECAACGVRFERRQGMNEAPVTKCPECGGRVKRLISGGAGFILKKGGSAGGKECSFETSGTTCCGSDTPCGNGSCERTI